MADMAGIVLAAVISVVAAALLALAAKIGYAFFMWTWLLLDRVMP